MSVITVGPDGTYVTISAAVAAAAAGDTIDVQAGTYTNDFPAAITGNLTLQGVGGMVNMVATEAVPNGKGILDVGGAGVTVTVNDFSFSGATVPDGNGVGIRYEAGTLTLNDDYFFDNQEGLLAAADPAGSITINASEFADNGAGDGFTHNLYVNEVGTLTVMDSYFTGAVVGHEIKSRALTTIIENNRIQDGPTGTASYDIDLPNGGNATISGNVIEKGPDAQNPIMISYGEEGGVYASSSLAVSNNTILYDLSTPDAVAVVNDTTSTATISGNSVYDPDEDQMAHGSADVTGTVFLTSEPPLDTSAPFTTACFLEGTRIRTPGGEQKVETLRRGDLVLTANGEAAPVRWLGMQTISRYFADPQTVLPIRVAAGALADGVPCRDLLLSPTHALFVDGVLIHAAALLNGASITVCTDMPAVFRYYHVELPHHAIIYAEGAPAETYLPDNEVLPFDNAAERPAGDVAEELPYPRVRAARQLPRAIRARLIGKAA